MDFVQTFEYFKWEEALCRVCIGAIMAQFYVIGFLCVENVNFIF